MLSIFNKEITSSSEMADTLFFNCCGFSKALAHSPPRFNTNPTRNKIAGGRALNTTNAERDSGLRKIRYADWAVIYRDRGRWSGFLSLLHMQGEMYSSMEEITLGHLCNFVMGSGVASM